YTFLSLRWTGSLHQWEAYHFVYKIIAGLATALVISVHTIVSLDFAVSLVGGWHSLIFPSFFVVGAIFSGFAMVQLLLCAMRYFLKLSDEISIDHNKNINLILLSSSLIMFLCYMSEILIGYSSNNHHEIELLNERLFGGFSVAFWGMVLCNILIPQFFWIRKLRNSITGSVLISIAICVGMWLERYIIVAGSLSSNNIMLKINDYSLTITEIGLFIGTLGTFILLFLLFIRFFPIISVHELLSMNHRSNHNLKKKGESD
ncbi:MAG: NrfD/PsrC family molybdoenzyme membrane anchor subunit, partial [Bacteroidales bacterium]